MTRKIVLTLAAAILLAACGSDDAEQTGQTTAPAGTADGDVSASALFERIDADTIYLAANLETMPNEIVDLFWEPLESMSEFNRATYNQMADSVADESALAAALMREFGAIDSREAWEQRGLHANGLWAIHAASIYPVMHWQLFDAAAFEATLERLAEEAETELPRRAIDDEEAIWIDLGNFGIALHHDSEFVTVALVPDNMALLRRVVNLDQPAQAYDPAGLRSFNSDNGFTAYGSGFVDFQGLAAYMLDADDELTEPARLASGLGAIEEEPACQQELTALTRQLPGLSMGMTEMDDRVISGMLRLDTNPELGQSLAGIADSPVGLDTGETGFVAAGLALNLIAARDFGRNLVAGWVDTPPECSLFSNVAENASDWQLALNRPIPPVVTNIHGFRLNLDNLTMGPEGGVSDVAGTLAVFMRNPQMLVGMAQMFSPELAELDLTVGGEPQPLPAGTIPNVPDLSLFIGMAESGIGLAAGESHSARLGDALAPSAESDSRIFGYTINMAAYARFMDNMIEEMANELENEDDMPPPDFMGMLAESYEETSVSVALTERGVELISSSTLKQ